MIEGVLGALIQICLVVLVVYVIFWVLGTIGVPLPPQVVQIVWVIVALFCLLIVVRMVLPGMGLRIGHYRATGDVEWQSRVVEHSAKQPPKQSAWLRQRSQPSSSFL